MLPGLQATACVSDARLQTRGNAQPCACTVRDCKNTHTPSPRRGLMIFNVSVSLKPVSQILGACRGRWKHMGPVDFTRKLNRLTSVM
jgi:hypothetical protein